MGPYALTPQSPFNSGLSTYKINNFIQYRYRHQPSVEQKEYNTKLPNTHNIIIYIYSTYAETSTQPRIAVEDPIDIRLGSGSVSRTRIRRYCSRILYMIIIIMTTYLCVYKNRNIELHYLYITHTFFFFFDPAFWYTPRVLSSSSSSLLLLFSTHTHKW